jgi:PAS domain S-box-containing protein
MVENSPNILAHIVDGVIVIDVNGVVLFANPAASALFQCRTDELIGCDFGFPVVSGESSESSEIQLRQGNRWLTVAMRVGEIDWEGEPAFLISLRDITQRKHMENQLRRADLLSCAILNSLYASIAVLDETGTIIRVNDMWAQFAEENGDPGGKTTGVGANYFDVCRSSDDEFSVKALAGMLAVLNSETPGFDLVYPCHAPHEERWFLLRVKPLLAEEFRGLVVSHINVTQYHQSLLVQSETEAQDKELQSQQLELLTLDLLSYPIMRPSFPGELTSEDREQFMREYAALLDDAVEQRAYHVEHHTDQRAEALAEQLVQKYAHPRDLVRMHTNILKRMQRSSLPSTKLRVYAEEGRFLLLQVLGYLAAHYRLYARSATSNG